MCIWEGGGEGEGGGGGGGRSREEEGGGRGGEGIWVELKGVGGGGEGGEGMGVGVDGVDVWRSTGGGGERRKPAHITTHITTSAVGIGLPSVKIVAEKFAATVERLEERFEVHARLK